MQYQNQNLNQSELPYLIPTTNAGHVNTDPNHKPSRSEKKAQKKALKTPQIGGNFIAPVVPREEFFMGHPTINEVQKPGVASGYGIPEYGRAGSPLNTGYGQQNVGSPLNTGYANTGASTHGTTHYAQGSPRVQYESTMPTTTAYTNQSLAGNVCYDQNCTQSTQVIQQQPVYVQQQPLVQQQPVARTAMPVQIQGYYDGMVLEQPHEKAGGFFAPFTGSFSNHGHGTTAGLQGQGKANFVNTIANQGGLPGTGLAGAGVPQNPLYNAPNLTYPVALEAERMKGLTSNKHVGLAPATGKLSRSEKKAQKKAMKNGTVYNPEQNNAAIY